MMEIDCIEKIVKEGYALTDEVIAKQLSEKQIKVVCCKGCSICCENMELLVLTFEIAVIGSYIKKLGDSEIKKGLIDNIKNFNHLQHECPFLVNKICGIYEVRPIICRTYYMKNKKCISGEKTETYSKDFFENFVRFNKIELLDAIKSFYRLYDFEDEISFRRALDDGFFLENTISLFDFDINNII
jgi:Fe-S-cluster containining protein